MVAQVDRDAQVRATRRRQALDALASERDREALLQEQLEEIVAEIDGPRVDADLYARLAPEDVPLVRAALGDVDPVAPDEDEEDLALYVDLDEEPDAADPEDEVVRLQDELTASRRRQDALERYLELLSDEPAGP